MKSLRLAIVKLWRELRDPYRPELHYMRGPGPRSTDRAQTQHSYGATGSPVGSLLKSSGSKDPLTT
jgi:hypothetical protein